MPRFFTTEPLGNGDLPLQPLYGYDCSDRLWGRLGEVIASAIESDRAGAAIEAAIDEARLSLALQPILPLDGTGAPVFEVLCRVDGASIGRLLHCAPGDAALYALDRWVIEQVCCRAQPGVRYSINLSGATISHFAIVEWLERQISTYNVDPTRLWLEITEQAIARATSSEVTVAGLAALKCQIVLDDFGTGFSNAEYLYRFCREVKVLKIDGKLTQAIEEPCAAEIIAGYCTIAAGLGLEVVLEQVSTLAIKEAIERLQKTQFAHAPRFWLQGYAVAGVSQWQ